MAFRGAAIPFVWAAALLLVSVACLPQYTQYLISMEFYGAAYLTLMGLGSVSLILVGLYLLLTKHDEATFDTLKSAGKIYTFWFNCFFSMASDSLEVGNTTVTLEGKIAVLAFAMNILATLVIWAGMVLIHCVGNRAGVAGSAEALNFYLADTSFDFAKKISLRASHYGVSRYAIIIPALAIATSLLLLPKLFPPKPNAGEGNNAV